MLGWTGMNVSPYNPLSFAVTAWRHKELILQLAWRRIESRYRGSMLGLSWALLEPLAMLGIYTFVFQFVFRARWGALPSEHGEFALFIFSGLIIFGLFSEAVNDAPQSILASGVFVKQLVFPTEILALVSVLAGLFKFSVSLVLLVVCYRVTQGNLPVASLYMPLIVMPVVLLTLGVTWFISSLGVFLRDLGQAVGLVTSGLLFASPIFYPASTIPDRFHSLYFLNPFAGVLEMSKRSLFEGAPPDLLELGLLMTVGWTVAWAGYGWFLKTKSGFANVL